jgi:cell wall-associated NlpC family hydrolase
MPTFSRRRMPLFALVATVVAAGAWPATTMTMPYHGHPPEPRQIIEPPAPTRAERAVRFALDQVGVPYRWGGESPRTGFDCSGLVRWAYGRVAIDLPHSSYALYSTGRRVSESGMEPGDIVFFEGLGHVGIYLGRGRMVHAPQTGRNVEVVRLGTTNYGSRWIGARRVAVN